MKYSNVIRKISNNRCTFSETAFSFVSAQRCLTERPDGAIISLNKNLINAFEQKE